VAVPVDIFVKDSSLIPIGVSGVRVNVYDTDGNFVSGTDTDGDGRAGFLLDGAASPDGVVYEARFFRPATFFQLNPVRIKVLEPLGVGESNQFDVSCVDGNAVSQSGSSFLCRVGGIFLDAQGRPLRNALVRFNFNNELIEKVPKVFLQQMLAADSFEIRTDDNGRVEVDLPRTAEYDVTFAGESDEVYCIKIPNACNVNLIDLIHPYPVLFDWDDTIAPGDTISVAVGQRLEVPFKVMFSDFINTRIDLQKWFTLMNSDETLFTLEADYSASKIWVTGKAPGSAEVEIEQKEDVQPVRWPFQSMLAYSLSVEVTP